VVRAAKVTVSYIPVVAICVCIFFTKNTIIKHQAQ